MRARRRRSTRRWSIWRRQGSAIVVISQDLDELLALCDTLAVINEGRLSRPMTVAEADIEEIGLLMGGVHGDAAGHAGNDGGHACSHQA